MQICFVSNPMLIHLKGPFNMPGMLADIVLISTYLPFFRRIIIIIIKLNYNIQNKRIHKTTTNSYIIHVCHKAYMKLLFK